ncbi:MAG: ABC transporter permease [Oscillospiraceae bacterium]|nr:ABC transporter permease [Oscillospiraceae bacterium]
MVKYILKRLLWFIPVMVCVIILVFSIMYITPGDPVMAILGANYTQEAYDIKVVQMGLDQPYIVQLWNYLVGIFTRLDFGTSYINNRAVFAQIIERFKPTFIIAVCGVTLSQLIAIPVGVMAATHHRKPLDYTVTSICVIVAAIPAFLLAMFGMLLFCLKLKWLPASGVTTWTGYILPILCSVLNPMVSSCRMTRSSMLEVVRQDYIRTARAKGVPEKMITRKHALKNALIPVLTMMGMHLGGAMGGSIVVETIFTVPGLGTLLKTAINNRDYPLVEGGVIFIAFIMCIMNLLTDLAYAAVDPRVRDQMSSGGKKKRRKQQKEKTLHAGQAGEVTV